MLTAIAVMIAAAIELMLENSKDIVVQVERGSGEERYRDR